MQKWQYRTLFSEMSGSFSTNLFMCNGQQKNKVCGKDENGIIQVLNMLGKEGWELVNLCVEKVITLKSR